MQRLLQPLLVARRSTIGESCACMYWHPCVLVLGAQPRATEQEQICLGHWRCDFAHTYVWRWRLGNMHMHVGSKSKTLDARAQRVPATARLCVPATTACVLQGSKSGWRRVVCGSCAQGGFNMSDAGGRCEYCHRVRPLLWLISRLYFSRRGFVCVCVCARARVHIELVHDYV